MRGFVTEGAVILTTENMLLRLVFILNYQTRIDVRWID